MIETALLPLQTAIYQRFSSDGPLNQIITGVHDAVKSDSVPPYITIGEPIVSPLETKSSYTENIPWVHHCYSRYNGKKETYQILNFMLKAMTKKPWVVDGFKVVKFNIEPNMQVFEDIVEGQYHGVLRTRFHIQKL